MKQIITPSFFILLMWTCIAKSSTITLRFDSYPDISKALASLQKPTTTSKQTLKRLSAAGQHAGILATYGGFLESSDPNGYIIFPRKHTMPKLSVLITPHITPSVMFEQTIHHWTIKSPLEAHLYAINQHTDEETGLHYWDVQDQSLPSDNIIPLETIIILAKSKNIVIPEGISLTAMDENLIAPAIYVKKGINTIHNSLYILQFSHLFRQAKTLHTQSETYHASQLNE